jgi:hypothetical protein
MKNTVPEHFWFIALVNYTTVQTHLYTPGEFSCTQYWRWHSCYVTSEGRLLYQVKESETGFQNLLQHF